MRVLTTDQLAIIHGAAESGKLLDLATSIIQSINPCINTNETPIHIALSIGHHLGYKLDSLLEKTYGINSNFAGGMSDIMEQYTTSKCCCAV